MYKFPIKIPTNLKVVLTQRFHTTNPVDLSKALSIQTTDHLGVDVVCGTPEQTWGQECVWPFPWDGIVYESIVDAPFGAKIHAHAQIDTTDPSTGIKYSIIYLHLSSVNSTKYATDAKIITYKQGDTIGKIGNNGEVNPPPTILHPYYGSHLHLGMGVMNPGEINYTMVDPLIYFDINAPFIIGETQSELQTVIKQEIPVLNTTTDPVVQQSMTQLIISQCKKFLGISP